MAAVDWQKVRMEYVTGSLSYAALAKKYAIPIRTITDHARTNKWVQARKDYRSDVVARTEKAAAKAEAQRAAQISKTADDLLKAIGKSLKAYEKDGSCPAKPLRELTGALKNIQEIQGVKSDRDIREQEARIANLEKQAAAADQDKTDTVVIQLEGGLSEYAQ